MRSIRTPPPKKNQENIEPASEMKKQQLKVALLCLANTVQGIHKRIKYQSITKIVMKSNKTDQKYNKIKFISFFSKAFLRRKMQQAFAQILKTKIRKGLIEKAVSALAIRYKRMQKDSMRRSLDKMRVNMSESKIQINRSGIRKSSVRPMGSPRLSEQSQRSNILSVSQDSLVDSKVVVYEDKRQYGNTDVQALKSQNQELKRMMLSQEAKQSLMKMQRFNRFNFNTETQKILKEPINDEMKRLQKMKNENKNMRTKLYDNELTIICLNNHIRMICEMNRQLQEGKAFQTKCNELQKKIHEINTLHKKQMSQSKKRLMVADTKDKNIIEIVKSESKQKKNNEPLFSHEEITTLNVLGSALKARKYKDIKRQAQQFLKKSRISEIKNLIRQLLVFSEETQTQQSKGSSSNKDRIQMNNIISLVDKYIRAQKPEQIVTLKNKYKGQTQFNELCILLQTVVQMAFDVKKLKKKDSLSAQKNKSNAEKQKLKKSIEFQNEQLKKQLKILQNKYNELTHEHEKLKQNLKKVQKPPRPSLISRKSVEKQPPVVDNQNEEMLKKIKQLEFNFQKKMENITKETALKVQKAKQSQEKLQTKLKNMQEEMIKKDNELADSKRLSQQLLDFTKSYEQIKKKIQLHENFARDLNQFKRYHNQSILLQILQHFQTQQTNKTILLNQIKNIISSFNDNSWKRKINMLQLKGQGELVININQIIEQLITLNKEKDGHLTIEKQLQSAKKREIKLKQQLQKLKKDTLSQKQSLHESQYSISAKTQKPTTPIKPSRTPERIQRTSADKQVTQLKSQNEKLKKQLSQLSSQKSKASTPIRNIQPMNQEAKQNLKYLQDASQCFENIRNKRTEGQNYKNLITNFKRKYQQGVFIELFDIIQKEDLASLTLNNQLKSTCLAFIEGSWKRKQEKIYLQNHNQLSTNLNKLIQITLNLCNKNEQFTADKKKEEIKQNNQIKYLNGVINSLNDGSWKKKQNILVLKDENQVNSLILQLTSNLFQLAKEKEESQRSIEQLGILQDKNSKLTNEITNLKQEILTLKSEMERMKIQNKQKLQSVDVREKLSAEKQKTVQQNQQIAKQKMDYNNLQLENKRIKAELDHAIKINAQSNKEIQRLASQVETLRRENHKHFQSHNIENIKDNEIKQLQNKIKQFELLLTNSESKIQYYSVLFQKYKQERDNLYLIIEEKEEDIETNQQNQEQVLKEKKQRQQKIVDLKNRYQQTQQNIKKIEKEVDKLLNQKQYHQKQRQMLEKKHQNEVSCCKQQIRDLQQALEQKNQVIRKMETQLQLTIGRINVQSSVKESQFEYQKKQISMLEEENTQLKARQRSYLQQSHQSFSQTQVINRSNIISDDQEKLQLRKQLELLNQQLAAHVRNSETEKRQMRQYIEKVNNDMQLQTMVYNEEKKILREGIQRARNQEYQINHEKMKKLREDIHNLRQENQRLRSIIDTNETSFNQLIQEHRQMAQKIQNLTQSNNQLIDQNQYLGKQNDNANSQKEELIEQLRFLENRISELQRQITVAIAEKNQLENSQVKSEDINIIITNLTEEKKLLEAKYIQQNHNIIELHKNYYKVQAELNSHKLLNKSGHSQHSFIEGGQHSRYLEDKIRHCESQVNRLMLNQKNLIGKIEGLMQTISTLEREKIQFTSIQRQKQFQFNFYTTNQNKQIQSLQNKISQLEDKLYKRQHELILSKSQVYQPNIESDFTNRSLEEQNRKLNNELIKNKHVIDSLQQNVSHLESKLQISTHAQVQNKIITSKFNDLQNDYRRLQSKVHSQEQEINRLKNHSVVEVKASSNSQQIEYISQKIVIQKKDEEIIWLKNQISSKDMQIQKLRNSQLQLISLGQRNQEKMIYLEDISIKYNREVSAHQQTKRQVTRQQEYFKTQLERQKSIIRETTQQLLNSEQNARQLLQNIQNLNNENRGLKQQAQSRKAETEALKEIVYQLDQDYILDGSEEQLQLKILQKISFEISQLIECNRELKFKCQSIENSMFTSSTEGSDSSFIQSLHYMVQNILLYLKEQRLINHKDVCENLKQLLIDSSNSSQIYISNLSIFLRTLIISLSSPHQTSYSKKIETVKFEYENQTNSNIIENFPRHY